MLDEARPTKTSMYAQIDPTPNPKNESKSLIKKDTRTPLSMSTFSRPRSTYLQATYQNLHPCRLRMYHIHQVASSSTSL